MFFNLKLFSVSLVFRLNFNVSLHKSKSLKSFQTELSIKNDFTLRNNFSLRKNLLIELILNSFHDFKSFPRVFDMKTFKIKPKFIINIKVFLLLQWTIRKLRNVKLKENFWLHFKVLEKVQTNFPVYEKSTQTFKCYALFESSPLISIILINSFSELFSDHQILFSSSFCFLS